MPWEIIASAITAILFLGGIFRFLLRDVVQNKFRIQVHVELKLLEGDPKQRPKLPSHEVDLRRVLVKEVVLRIARKYGGVKVCCPPLKPKSDIFKPKTCKWCWDEVSPEPVTGKCPHCPLNVKTWGIQ